MYNPIHFIFNVFLLVLLIFFPVLGQINFWEGTVDNNVHGVGGIFTCDLDNDMDIDILGASLQDNQIIWWRNDGGEPIIWTKIIIGSNVGEAHSVYAADFNGDNLKDVVGAAYVGTPGIAWWRNNGGNPVTWTKFTVANNFINAHEVCAYDLDKDNDMDILGASSDLNRIAWWRNDGGDPIVWTEQILSNNVTLAKSVTVGDLDRDQDNDVIGVSIANNDVIWWRNDGGQPIQWTQFLVDGNFGGAHRVQAVDLNDDSNLDILGAGYLSHQIAWWRNDGGDPVVWTKQVIESGFTNACIAYAIDLDGDNDKDVIGTGQGINQIAWWRNDGGEPIQWAKFIITNNFTRPWPLYADTLNDDEKIDIVVGSSHNGSNLVKWWRNEGISGIEDKPSSPTAIKLFQNYPNPFNPSTIINYSIPKLSFVTLKVYDVLGSEVATLVEEEKFEGNYYLQFSGAGLPSGIYFYQLKAGSFVETKNMLLLK
ncbi:MAG: T9SS type A sorting domain-containing protein [Ignavibacteriaceae bacterium]|nr:T9SS type A sorting domain-containing protein [Ignavibacteriaceae bacterium]